MKQTKTLCKEIGDMMGKMPHNVCEAFRAVYPEINILVQLTNMGKCNPTEKSRPDLETYYQSVEREYARVRNS